jgi:hypothetical protein
MRNITKIVLIFILGFAAFLLWPRNPSMMKFDPESLAAAKITAWQGEAGESRWSHGFNVFNLYFKEHGFSAISSLRIAWHQTQGEALLMTTHEMEELDRMVFPVFAEKHAIIRRDTASDFDDRAAAWQEVLWRSKEIHRKPVHEVVDALASQLAQLHGKEPAEMAPVARLLIGARAVLRGEQALEEGEPFDVAQNLVTEAYSQIQMKADTFAVRP